MSGYRFQYLKPLILLSSCLVALSVVMAVSLFGQQKFVAVVLRENVQSQRAAVELEECLMDIIALEDDRVSRVSVLHTRIALLLNQVKLYADQQQEQELHVRMQQAFDVYLKQWSKLPATTDPGYEEARRRATRFLESDVLKPCQEFEHFNTQRLGETPQQHERGLRQLAWGMVGIGVMGGGAGLVLGYGIARSLARSIRRLQVQLRDAAGKLDLQPPEIVLTEEGEFGGLHADMERISTRIEQVVHDLQSRELEVLRAEQLAAVGQLAAGVAHEIRNPLTAIKLLVQSGLEDGTGISLEELAVIEGEVRRMETSLNTFLGFARPPKLERRPVVVNQLLKNVAELLRPRAERQQVQLKLILPVELEIIGDAEELRQVMVNLGLNALDVLPNGGELAMDLRVELGKVKILFLDSGPGILPGIMPRLFTPFASSKETGLGLGLVISRRIVEAHGGTLTGTNRPNGGAEFLVCLPMGDR